MPSRTQRMVGWILTGLLGLFLIVGSGTPKFLDFPGKEEMLNKMGISSALLSKIGVLEIIISILFLIPRTSFLGAILITAYLGGAVVTHLRIGEPWFFPVVIGVVLWVALGLRQPAIFKLALGQSLASDKSEGNSNEVRSIGLRNRKLLDT